MGVRLNRTLLNWRWWVFLPAFVAYLPIVALDLTLAAVVAAGGVAGRARRWLGEHVVRIPIKWIQRGAAHDRQ